MTSLVSSHGRERELIFAIGRALMAEMELNEVLRVILYAATDLVQSKMGAVILAQPDEQAFRIVATYGMPGRVLEEFTDLVQGIPYDKATLREALDEVALQVREMAEYVDKNLSRSIGLPLQSPEGIIGAIFMFQTHEYSITKGMAEFLQNFTAWAAIAVRNARLYDAVFEEKKRLDAIIEQSADGVMILDQRLDVTSFNAALTQMTGIGSAEAQDKSWRDIRRWQTLATETDLMGAVANGWPLPGAGPLYVEGDWQKTDGTRVSLGVTYAPLLSDKGKMTNIIANFRDLTRYREEEKLQKTFISVVSHELKTPVSIIKGYAGTLQREDVEWPREVMDEYLETIIEEADSLTDLIDNLLEASRLQAGTFSLDAHPDLLVTSIVRSVVKKFATQTEKHDITINFPQKFPEVPGDEKRITQVLNNLISNAIKYSPEGGEIAVTGEFDDEHIIVHVRDTGIGIPKHESHRIFQQFSRLDNALSRQTEGTGLGLFLTRAIVLAHRGSIWFENNSEGGGTTFSFSLPLEEE